jgi:transaldolase
MDEAEATMAELAGRGIDVDAVTATLLDEGVAQFRDAFAKMLAAIDDRIRSIAA